MNNELEQLKNLLQNSGVEEKHYKLLFPHFNEYGNLESYLNGFCSCNESDYDSIKPFIGFENLLKVNNYSIYKNLLPYCFSRNIEPHNIMFTKNYPRINKVTFYDIVKYNLKDIFFIKDALVNENSYDPQDLDRTLELILTGIIEWDDDIILKLLDYGAKVKKRSEVSRNIQLGKTDEKYVDDILATKLLRKLVEENINI